MKLVWRNISGPALAYLWVAAGLTILSYAVMTGYDVLAIPGVQVYLIQLQIKGDFRLFKVSNIKGKRQFRLIAIKAPI